MDNPTSHNLNQSILSSKDRAISEMLTDLPEEILIAIAEELVIFDVQYGFLKLNISSFLLLCRRTYKASRQVLNRYFVYTRTDDKNGDGLLQQLTTIYHGDHLSQLRHIRAQHWSDPELSEAWKEIGCITSGQIFDPETTCKYLYREAPNLQSLDVEYPTQAKFLNVHSETIRSLSVRSEIAGFQTPDLVAQKHKIPVYNPLRMSFLPFVMNWPRLQHLCITSSKIFFDRNLNSLALKVPPGSSPVTHLEFRMEECKEPMMRALIEAPKALKSFIYAPKNKWPHVSDATCLPTLRGIAESLAKHSDTLEVLKISRAGSTWCDRMDKLGSLLCFSKLKHLELDYMMVHGMPHCMYLRFISPELNAGPVPTPQSIATYLPLSLDTLTFFIERQLFDQGWRQFMLRLVEGIVSELQSGHLSNLRQVKIKLLDCMYRHNCQLQLRGDFILLDKADSLLEIPTMMDLISLATQHSCEVLLDDDSAI